MIGGRMDRSRLPHIPPPPHAIKSLIGYGMNLYSPGRDWKPVDRTRNRGMMRYYGGYEADSAATLLVRGGGQARRMSGYMPPNTSPRVRTSAPAGVGRSSDLMERKEGAPPAPDSNYFEPRFQSAGVFNVVGISGTSGRSSGRRQRMSEPALAAERRAQMALLLRKQEEAQRRKTLADQKRVAEQEDRRRTQKQFDQVRAEYEESQRRIQREKAERKAYVKTQEDQLREDKRAAYRALSRHQRQSFQVYDAYVEEAGRRHDQRRREAMWNDQVRTPRQPSPRNVLHSKSPPSKRDEFSSGERSEQKRVAAAGSSETGLQDLQHSLEEAATEATTPRKPVDDSSPPEQVAAAGHAPLRRRKSSVTFSLGDNDKDLNSRGGRRTSSDELEQTAMIEGKPKSSTPKSADEKIGAGKGKQGKGRRGSKSSSMDKGLGERRESISGAIRPKNTSTPDNANARNSLVELPESRQNELEELREELGLRSGGREAAVPPSPRERILGARIRYSKVKLKKKKQPSGQDGTQPTQKEPESRMLRRMDTVDLLNMALSAEQQQQQQQQQLQQQQHSDLLLREASSVHAGDSRTSADTLEHVQLDLFVDPSQCDIQLENAVRQIKGDGFASVLAKHRIESMQHMHVSFHRGEDDEEDEEAEDNAAGGDQMGNLSYDVDKLNSFIEDVLDHVRASSPFASAEKGERHFTNMDVLKVTSKHLSEEEAHAFRCSLDLASAPLPPDMKRRKSVQEAIEFADQFRQLLDSLYLFNAENSSSESQEMMALRTLSLLGHSGSFTPDRSGRMRPTCVLKLMGDFDFLFFVQQTKPVRASFRHAMDDESEDSEGNGSGAYDMSVDMSTFNQTRFLKDKVSTRAVWKKDLKEHMLGKRSAPDVRTITELMERHYHDTDTLSDTDDDTREMLLARRKRNKQKLFKEIWKERNKMFLKLIGMDIYFNDAVDVRETRPGFIQYIPEMAAASFIASKEASLDATTPKTMEQMNQMLIS